MKKNNILNSLLFVGVLSVFMASCVSSGDNPGIEYAPNMYTSQAYEPFSQETKSEYNPYGMTMRLPVRGTIAQGQLGYVYPYPNSGDGYEAAAGFMPNVLATEKNVANGEKLYNIYCQQCHGKTGGNDGSIFKSGKMPGPSWAGYQDDYIKNIPVGKIYHTITYGKGLMGSHAPMLSPSERWNVIHYVKKLSLGEAFKYDQEVNSVMASNSTQAQGSENGEMNSSAGASSGSGLDAEYTPSDRQMIEAAMSKVMFKMARADIKETSLGSLDQVAAYLKAHPTLKAVITGHTGKTLSKDNSEELSAARAAKVKEYLISKGVNASALTTKAKGSSEIEGGDITSADDRKANRRVEITIYK